MAKLSKLAVKFELIIKEIKLFEAHIKTCDENETKINILKHKLDCFETKLNDVFSDMSSHDSESYFEEYSKSKDLLLNWLIEIESKKVIDKSNQKCCENTSNSNQIKPNIKVPKIEIQHLYGAENWLNFKEIFKASILDNNSLSDIEKLTYLQSAVKGDAAKLIRGFSINADNLKNCWDVLNERFDNTRQLAITQINKIFNMKIQKANNSKLLLEIVDICNEAIRNLKSLNLVTNDLTELIIINCLTAKIDESIIQRWELNLETDSFPTLDTFKKFIEREARGLNEIKSIKSENKKFPPRVPNMNNPNILGSKKLSVNSTVIKPKSESGNFNSCLVCKQHNHALFKCQVFNNMSVNNRWNIVREHKLCQNCLRANHEIDNCRINISCKNCSARHHTLLHIYVPANTTQNTESVSSVTSSLAAIAEKNVLLSTALVKIKSPTGKFIRCRALIDNASQHSLISKNCAELLNLQMNQSTHRLIGINQTVAETSLFATKFEVSPYFSEDYFTVNALIVSKVTTALPNFIVPYHTWPHLENLTLADPSFFVKDEIDLLLGADLFLPLVVGTPIIGPKGTPSALPTKLGHILSGSIDTPVVNRSSVVCHTTSNIDDTLKSFWELEAVSKPRIQTDEDDLCETIFVKSHSRTAEGRYMVRLPFKENSELGASKDGALKRFYSLERKLQTDGALREKYVEFMNEYKELNHMTPTSSNSQGYFIPHHGVMNDNSVTTKLRVVFDGSFKTSNGNSLNDVLFKGRKLQSDIFTLLLKFRTFPVAFSADVAKMYRQILMSPNDIQFQKIFWRNSPDEPLEVYTLNTVTYGTVSAPYLAIRTIKQLCQDEKLRFPLASKLAEEHFYVDDCIAGADSVEAAKSIINELINFMAAGGFELRKWSSSHPEAISHLPSELKASTFSHSFEEDSAQRVLGLFWDLQADAFQVRAVLADSVSTKRQLLSVIARTFDPLGFVAPSIIILKIMLQDIWKENLDWDDPLPTEILKKWNTFQSEIHYLKDIKIPRYLQIAPNTELEVHGFCDASSKAYAGVIYLKVKSIPPSTFLVAAKTRVAPVQPITLPRLELSGALLLSELMHTVKESLNLTSCRTYLWCDSTITLSWINNPPTKGNQFVQHRVSKIHSLTDTTSWHHIPGILNPADLATRGLSPKQLVENPEWLYGPRWLADNNDFSTYSTEKHQSDDDSYSPTPDNSNDISVCVSTEANPDLNFIEAFSSYSTLIRIVAWILRFHHNLKASTKIHGYLQATELNKATIKLVKLLQDASFKSDINLLKSKKPLHKSSKLIALHPFLDDEGILRVGGRLRHQQHLTFDQKYPMLLPKNHHFTTLLIRHHHLTNLHAGQELVLSIIRQKFWISDGKSTVRKILRKCIDCFKVNARPLHQIMGDLPKERISPSRPFAKVGVDFAGPLSTKCQHSRKSTLFKSYICLFICMCTKAVHLELVSSLTTDAFLAALRRFISRRGYPSDIFSDNGKNFVGASSHFKALIRLAQHAFIQDYSSNHNITWHFIPPYSPNFGGLWEASIKLTKTHLAKTCKSAILTFEELSTLLCQIEACINSRPIYPLSPDPHDLSALTPGHFLIGCPLLELPENNTNISVSLSHRWKLLLQMKQQFWTRWQTSYLQSLQPRSRWLQNSRLIQKGALVLVKEPNSTSTTWHLGRIADVHPGTDGIVRAVTIHSSRGLIKRSVHSIALLPLPDDDSSAAGPEDVKDRE